MRKIKFLLLLPAFLLCLFSACKEENKAEAKPADSHVETRENPKETAMLNPAHGVDGHRCDLPVGASLADVPAVNGVATPTTNTGVSPVFKKEYQPAKNPAHGLPGHDCSKPVGADL